MGIRSKFKGRNTKKCILKAAVKKNATPKKTTCFVFPQTFSPNFLIFLHRYICHICGIMQLCSLEALVVQYRSGSGTNFFKIHAVLLVVYIVLDRFPASLEKCSSSSKWVGETDYILVSFKSSQRLGKLPSANSSKLNLDQSLFQTARPGG